MKSLMANVVDLSRAQGSKVDPPKSVEIIISTLAYKNLFGKNLSESGYRPWKRGIVAIRNVHDDHGRVVYRRPRASSHLSMQQCAVSLQTLRELHDGPIDFGAELELRGTSIVWGRLLFYWNNPEDETRAGYRLGLVGLFLGVVGLILGILPIVCRN